MTKHSNRDLSDLLETSGNNYPRALFSISKHLIITITKESAIQHHTLLENEQVCKSELNLNIFVLFEGKTNELYSAVVSVATQNKHVR